MLKNYENSGGFLELHNVKKKKNFDKVHFFYQALLFIRSFTLCLWFLRSTRKGQSPFIRQPRITSD